MRKLMYAQCLAMFILCAFPCATTQEIAAKNNSSKAETASTVTIPDRNVGARSHDDTYIIGVDDVLAINVWKEPEVSKTVPVRSDGKISLPLAGEVQASGKTPHQLEVNLSEKLAS